MAYDLSIFTNLYAQAGNNSDALQAKFPFLCDLPTLTRTLTNHPMVSDSRMNPNGYDSATMAISIIQWFDKYADYNTGNMPTTILEKATNGIVGGPTSFFWSQKAFWYLGGIYDVDQDPGYAFYSVTSSAKYYSSVSNISVSAATGSYHTPVNAAFSHQLYNYGPIDYVRRTDNGEGLLYVPVVSSDDLYSIFWEKTVFGSTTDTTGATVDVKDTYPFSMQTATESYVGYNARSPSSPVPNGTINGLTNLLTRPSEANLTDYASLMFKADAKITSKSQTLETGGVAPTYSVIVPYDGWLVLDPTTSTEPVPLTNMFEDNGNRPFDGTELIQRLALAEDPDVYYNSLDILNPCNPNVYDRYLTESIALKFIVESNVLKFDTRTPGRGTGYYHLRGLPVYKFRIEYSTVADPTTMLYKTVNIAFNHLKNWTMYLYDAIVSLNTTGSKVIGNSSFVCGTDGVGGTDVNFTGEQTYKDSYIQVDTAGRGYENATPSTTITGGTWGRFGSSRVDYGKQVKGRIDEDVINVPMSTYLTITDTVRFRPERYVYKIANSNNYYAKSSKNYTRPWFGTDNRYENQGFGCFVFLDGGNKVESIGTDQTPSDNAFAASCPGYVYPADYYHIDRQPYGYTYPYTRNGNTKGEFIGTDFDDFLNDPLFFNKSAAVYDVVLTDGKVTALNPISRPDGDGTNGTNGWDYYSDHNNRELYFVITPGTGLSNLTIQPKVYYMTNGASFNGIGNSVTIPFDHPDFFAGHAIPEDAYLYAIALRSTPYAPSVMLDNYDNLDGSGIDTATSRELFPDFYPTAIKITSERPVLRSTTRSLIDNIRSTGAQRYSFTYTYPPMRKNEAQELIAAFEQYRSGEKAFSIRLPKIGFKLFNEFRNNSEYSNYVQIVQDGEYGDTEIVIDGLPMNTTNVVTEGTYFKVQDDTKLYQIVRNANSNSYGQARLRVEPPMRKDNSFKTIYMDNSDYVWVVVRFADDALSYTTDGSGLYILELNFVEALG